jgi:hypothetical protein
LSSEFKNKILQQSIDNAVLVKPDLWTVRNVFDSATLDNILARVELETEWILVEKQENLPRVCLPWNSDGLISEIRSMTNELDLSKYGLKFKTATVWKDSAGYKIGPHRDNERVEGAMQIYLNNAPENLGTWFEDTEIPFVKNTGYIMKNKNKTLHGMKHDVPSGTTRYSLYALFDLI